MASSQPTTTTAITTTAAAGTTVNASRCSPAALASSDAVRGSVLRTRHARIVLRKFYESRGVFKDEPCSTPTPASPSRRVRPGTPGETAHPTLVKNPPRISFLGSTYARSVCVGKQVFNYYFRPRVFAVDSPARVSPHSTRGACGSFFSFSFLFFFVSFSLTLRCCVRPLRSPSLKYFSILKREPLVIETCATIVCRLTLATRTTSAKSLNLN